MRAPTRKRMLQPPQPLPDHWEPGPGVLWTAVEDATLLMSLDTEEYFVLHGVASAMWHEVLATDPVTAALAIHTQYRVTVAEAQRDLHAFLGELAAANLIRPSPKGPHSHGPQEIPTPDIDFLPPSPNAKTTDRPPPRPAPGPFRRHVHSDVGARPGVAGGLWFEASPRPRGAKASPTTRAVGS